MNAKVKDAVRETAKTETITAESLPTVAVIPGTEPKTEAEATQSAIAEAMAATTEVTDSLRKIVRDARNLTKDMAEALVRGWIASGPNAEVFKRFMKSCEATILSENKVEKWADLGSECRSYTVYKSQFAWFIETNSMSCPGKVEDALAIRGQVTAAYNARNLKGVAPRSKKTKDAEQAPQVGAGKTADGDGLTMSVGASGADIKVKGADGKFTTQRQNFPTPVMAALARLSHQVGYALHDGVKPDAICKALQAAHDAIGKLD